MLYRPGRPDRAVGGRRGRLWPDRQATGPTPTHAYGEDGEFSVTLRVPDDQDRSDTDTGIRTVLNVNPPVTIESVTIENSSQILGLPTTWSSKVPFQGFLPLVEMTCLSSYGNNLMIPSRIGPN